MSLTIRSRRARLRPPWCQSPSMTIVLPRGGAAGSAGAARTGRPSARAAAPAEAPAMNWRRVEAMVVLENALEGQDPSGDRDRRRVRRVHAVVVEPAGAERARLGVRRVRRVVDDPEVDR